MKKRQASPEHGFTLIELLVVISIIMILAGLTLSLFTYANTKAGSDRARAEISALSLAIESYKIENGDYPRDDTATDKLDAKTSTSALISSGAYQAASLVLYKALSGDTDLLGVTGTDSATNTKNTVYFEFKPGVLYPKVAGGAKRTTQITALLDPFRNVYGYSTIGTATSGTSGYNPTFDLWCTVDPKQTGGTPEVTWIKNW